MEGALPPQPPAGARLLPDLCSPQDAEHRLTSAVEARPRRARHQTLISLRIEQACWSGLCSGAEGWPCQGKGTQGRLPPPCAILSSELGAGAGKIIPFAPQGRAPASLRRPLPQECYSLSHPTGGVLSVPNPPYPLKDHPFSFSVRASLQEGWSFVLEISLDAPKGIENFMRPAGGCIWVKVVLGHPLNTLLLAPPCLPYLGWLGSAC